jgi:hypothetical protein
VSGHFSDDVFAMQIRAPGLGSAAVRRGDRAAAERGENHTCKVLHFPPNFSQVSGPMDNPITGFNLSQWCAASMCDFRKTSVVSIMKGLFTRMQMINSIMW